MMMQVALAQTEELTNSGTYWSNNNCDDPTDGSDDKTSKTGTSTRALGVKFFGNEGYIEYALGYDICVVSDTIGFDIIAKQRGGSCTLRLDETTVVSETSS